MRTINVSKNSNKETEIFFDPITSAINGFAGVIEVRDSKVYVDTRTGKGYDEVISKLDKLINYLAAKYHFNGFSIDDTKQHIVVHILEGIPKYDPRKEVKLSTFLQMRITRRLINELRNESRFSKNATMLNVVPFNIACKCGHSFNLSIPADDDLSEHKCPQCKSGILGNHKKMAVNCAEFSLDQYLAIESEHGEINAELSEEDSLFFNDRRLEDSMITNRDVQKWLANEDPQIVKLVELICLHDYSVKDAAQEVGISGAWANVKLKGLKNKRIVREIFGR